MKTQNWFKDLLTSLKDTFDFRLETLILNITEKICKNMKLKGISRTDLAQKLKVSPPAVTKILNGNSNFTLRTLLSLSDAMDLELVVDLKEKNKYVTIQECSYTSLAKFAVEAYPANYIASSIPGFESPYLSTASYLSLTAIDQEDKPNAKVYNLPKAA